MPPVPSLFRRAPKDQLAGPISAFESETQGVIVATTPYSEHAIVHVLGFLLVATIIIASVVTLEKVVTGKGTVVPTRGQIYLNPLDTAMVSAIKVHVGDVVKKGQSLATLDPTFANADKNQLEERRASDRALVNRLEAEQNNSPYIGGESKEEKLQLSIWQQRQDELKQTLADFDARINSSAAAVRKAEQNVTQYEESLGYASRLEDMAKTLEKDGNGSKLQLIQASSQRADVQRQLTEARNILTGSRHDLEALTAQRAVAVGKWQDDVGTQLATARNDLATSEQGLQKANRVSELISLDAPEDSVVLNIGQASAGTVVSPNRTTEPLFTLVPLNGPIEAEVQISSEDVGFIRPGDTVNIKIDAYNYLIHGLAKGLVKTISEGSFTNASSPSGDGSGGSSQPFFKARVEITHVDLHDVPPDMRLIPGETLTGDVLVGHRTILSYLISGAMRTFSEAMREP